MLGQMWSGRASVLWRRERDVLQEIKLHHGCNGRSRAGWWTLLQRYLNPARDGQRWEWGQAGGAEKGLGTPWGVWGLEACLGV